MTEMNKKQTGTTTLGIICKDAVVIGADQKSTMGYLVASKDTRKIFQLDDHIGFSVAGGVADAQAMVRLLKAQFSLYKMDRGPITLKAAANLLSNIMHGSRYFPYLNQFILAGYDNLGSHIYSFDPVGGFDENKDFFSTGSGSPFVFGVLESDFKENMSIEDAIKLAVKALKAAIERDIASGGKGFILAVIDEDGYKEIDTKKYM